MITKIETRYIPIPGDLLTCPELPVPDGVATDRDVAEYLLALFPAAMECRRKLLAVREIQGE